MHTWYSLHIRCGKQIITKIRFVLSLSIQWPTDPPHLTCSRTTIKSKQFLNEGLSSMKAIQQNLKKVCPMVLPQNKPTTPHVQVVVQYRYVRTEKPKKGRVRVLMGYIPEKYAFIAWNNILYVTIRKSNAKIN